MKPEIVKIKLGELEAFLQSDRFQHLPVIPVTPERVKSYLSNPNAKTDDTVLYTVWIDAKVAAFRTVFAGIAKTEKGEFRFGWCSGNWVDPVYRRKGLSGLLLREAYSDWDGKLMFTNYAPASERLYLKTGWFHPIHRFEGARAYLFPKTRKLVPAAKNRFLHRIFFLTDVIISVFSHIRLWFYRAGKMEHLRFAISGVPDEQCFSLVQKYSNSLFFGRDEKELTWIFKFPWITSQPVPEEKYPFSWHSESFAYRCVKIFSKGEFTGFFIFSVRDGHCKTLYFCLPEAMEKEVAGFLKLYCKKERIERITVYHQGVAKHLLNDRFPFLGVKKYGQNIYSSFEAGDIKNYRFQDGDGDTFFT